MHRGFFEIIAFIDMNGNNDYDMATDIRAGTHFMEYEQPGRELCCEGVCCSLYFETSSFTIVDPFIYTGNDTAYHEVDAPPWGGGVIWELGALAGLLPGYVYDFQRLNFGFWAR